MIWVIGGQYTCSLRDFCLTWAIIKIIMTRSLKRSFKEKKAWNNIYLIVIHSDIVESEPSFSIEIMCTFESFDIFLDTKFAKFNIMFIHTYIQIILILAGLVPLRTLSENLYSNLSGRVQSDSWHCTTSRIWTAPHSSQRKRPEHCATWHHRLTRRYPITSSTNASSPCHTTRSSRRFSLPPTTTPTLVKYKSILYVRINWSQMLKFRLIKNTNRLIKIL